jgi:predicted dehydrogenase/nucleoside-diphosphate-sugar epimerase
VTQPPIRTAIIGAGYIADWHADAISMIEGVNLVAVCDLSKPSADAFALARGIKGYSDLDQLIEDRVCDAVHILTPPDSHAALAIKCLEAGLDCFVEKPVALSAQDTAKINDTAKAQGRRFAAGHNFLGIPAYKRLKAAKDAGELGRITSAEINWHFPLGPLRSGPFGLWLLREPRNLLLELGPHLFAFAVDLFGDLEIEHLSLGKPIDLPTGGSRPQSWRILARAGDVDITINLSLVETMDDRSVNLRGTVASARLNYADDTLIIDRENSSDIVFNPLIRQLYLSGQNAIAGVVNFGRQLLSLNRKSAYGLSFQGALTCFYDGLQNGTEMDLRFSGDSAVKVMTAIDATLDLLPMQDHIPAPTSGLPANPDVLVIGGTGFIGRELVRALVKTGRAVRVLSRGQNGPFRDIENHVELFSCALSDADALAKAMVGIKTVYHLGKSMDETWEAALKNDVGVTELIARVANKAAVERFVYTGTIASYDMSDPAQIITEKSGFSTDMSDRNIYARSKAACEAKLLEMHKNDGLPLVIARPGIVVGKGGPLQHWGIGRWHGAGVVRVWGQGTNPLPFVLISDVVDGLIRMADNSDAVGQSFNLVASTGMTAKDYFDAIHQELGARIVVKPGNLTVFYLAAGVKYGLKKWVLRKRGLSRPSRADWKSRAHFSPFDNQLPKDVLAWQPVEEKSKFVKVAITDANLFGF